MFQGVPLQTVAGTEGVQRSHGHGDRSEVRPERPVHRLLQHGPDTETVRTVSPATSRVMDICVYIRDKKTWSELAEFKVYLDYDYPLSTKCRIDRFNDCLGSSFMGRPIAMHLNLKGLFRTLEAHHEADPSTFSAVLLEKFTTLVQTTKHTAPLLLQDSRRAGPQQFPPARHTFYRADPPEGYQLCEDASSGTDLLSEGQILFRLQQCWGYTITDAQGQITYAQGQITIPKVKSVGTIGTTIFQLCDLPHSDYHLPM
ncbi:hypothetical protein J6590_081921 [Homalodisca vitripennis]|nr:hypothetical protein J6590_081921 [Homalodisca vitripennis]